MSLTRAPAPLSTRGCPATEIFSSILTPFTTAAIECPDAKSASSNPTADLRNVCICTPTSLAWVPTNLGRQLAHQCELVTIRIDEFGEPEFHLRRAIHDVGFGLEFDSPRFERCVDRVNIRNAEVD